MVPNLQYYDMLYPITAHTALRDLSKQFWCPLYGTKNTIFWLSFETHC